MATGYTLELGYQSGYSSHADAWEALKAYALYLCDHPAEIYDEARKFGAPDALDGERLMDYAARYHGAVDLTLVIQDPEGDEKGHVYQCASGGAPARVLKEHLRRAFCRLVIAEMHRKGIEVNLTVS